MSVQICLEEVEGQCSFVPLAVFGYCLTQTNCLKPVWDNMDIQMKSYRHQPVEKLQDILVAILAGCPSMASINTKLRPEQVLANAWKRKNFADQSTLSRILDSLERRHVQQLQAGHLALMQKYSQLRQHDWKQPIVLDIDPTSLVASKNGDGCHKGWVSGRRNQYCRHVIRLTVAGYHESLLSQVYPGNRHGYEYCKPALKKLVEQWPTFKTYAPSVIIRSDAEQGTDANLSYILWAKFQLLMKGYSGRRTNAWVKQTDTSSWQSDPSGKKRWLAPAPAPLRLGRNLRSHLLRWPGKKGTFTHAMLHSTLDFSPFDLWNFYDQRAITEIEIRNDKSGLSLDLRRKQSLYGLEAWVILTDIAHNLLAWLEPWMLADTAFSGFGPKRLVSNLFHIPGHIYIENGRLQKVTLWRSHPYASEMRFCLNKLLKTFDLT